MSQKLAMEDTHKLSSPLSRSGAIDWQATDAEAVAHFKALLRIDTTNPPGNERPAAEYIASILNREGIDYEIVESEPTRASIVARLRGTGREAPLLLNGHLDVVPAEAEHWRYPPFDAVEAEGHIWGRGAIDMKNMVVMSLMSLILLKRTGTALDRDVIFAGVADEEAGSGKGARFLVDEHPELVRSEYVLNEVGGHTFYVGDQTFYPVQVSEKGICWFELTASGEPGHGSMPRPDSAVVRLAQAIERLGNVRLPQHNTPVVERFLRTIASRAPLAQRKAMPLLLEPRLAGLLLTLLGKQDRHQALGMNALLRNTASPTVLSGGRKVNVIPSAATVQVDGRLLPGQTVEMFLREVRAVVGSDLSINVFEQHEASTFTQETPLFDAICETVRRRDPEGLPVPYMIPGFTDSAQYGRLGATCYGFSPVRLGRELNFAAMYHGHNERIPVEGFCWGLRTLYELVQRFCAAG